MISPFRRSSPVGDVQLGALLSRRSFSPGHRLRLDSSAQKIGVSDLRQRAQVHHLFGHRCLLVPGWSSKPGPSGKSPAKDRGRFVWPRTEGEAMISAAQLDYLLEGIDWRLPKYVLAPAGFADEEAAACQPPSSRALEKPEENGPNIGELQSRWTKPWTQQRVASSTSFARLACRKVHKVAIDGRQSLARCATFRVLLMWAFGLLQ